MFSCVKRGEVGGVASALSGGAEVTGAWVELMWSWLSNVSEFAQLVAAYRVFTAREAMSAAMSEARWVRPPACAVGVLASAVRARRDEPHPIAPRGLARLHQRNRKSAAVRLVTGDGPFQNAAS
jgi:hypothetical protein